MHGMNSNYINNEIDLHFPQLIAMVITYVMLFIQFGQKKLSLMYIFNNSILIGIKVKVHKNMVE